MKKIVKLHIVMFLVIATIIGQQTSFAEENIDRLIMSEVYLDENDPSKNWIEVYNPTDELLTLIRLRLSTLLTPNILHKDYNEGIEILPNQRIVLCAEENNIKSNVVKVEIKPLSITLRGGFIGIETKKEKGNNFKKENVDMIRYGNPERSSYVRAFSDIQVIPTKINERSYSRDISLIDNSIDVSIFHESIPTPGE